MRMLVSPWIVSLCSLLSLSIKANPREEPICGKFQEKIMFQLWHLATPKIDETRAINDPLIDKISFTTADNRTLRGYKYSAHDMYAKSIKSDGYVLMALGNSMIASDMIIFLKSFARDGLDSYIYDYRGYGNSDGLRRIKAMIEDYKELVAHLNTQYQTGFLYGVSLGGAVVANAIGKGAKFSKAVIDSSPSKFSTYGCPVSIDPVNNLPEDASSILVITGEKDLVTPAKMTAEFREKAKSKGAETFNGPLYSHPYMDKDFNVHQERVKRVLDFFNAPG